MNSIVSDMERLANEVRQLVEMQQQLRDELHDLKVRIARLDPDA